MAQAKLNEHMQDTPVYFYDGWNSTFYFKPNEIENGLEDLRGWYLDTKANIDAFLKENAVKNCKLNSPNWINNETYFIFNPWRVWRR